MRGPKDESGIWGFWRAVVSQLDRRLEGRRRGAIEEEGDKKGTMDRDAGIEGG